MKELIIWGKAPDIPSNIFIDWIEGEEHDEGV